MVPSQVLRFLHAIFVTTFFHSINPLFLTLSPIPFAHSLFHTVPAPTTSLHPLFLTISTPTSSHLSSFPSTHYFSPFPHLLPLTSPPFPPPTISHHAHAHFFSPPLLSLHLLFLTIPTPTSSHLPSFPSTHYF